MTEQPPTPPITFDADVLYDKEAIGRVLGSAISVARFLARVRPPQLFKGVYRGGDILKSIALAPTLEDDTRSSECATVLTAPCGPLKHPAVAPPGLERIDPASFSD